ncbi:unnamed protein product [Spirodela intermedia]|uniref:Uncharacterized protein n=1 Tax=Spirodela intermedia TaxID=51605 RepID=A0A7I8LCI1_SPIIN|nr:unnamed protein product [Spirodela intermedia]
MCQGASSSGLHSKRRLFIVSVLSLACTTTPCPTAGWPPVMWKGSGAHMPLSVQAARALACGYSPTELPTHLRARLASGSPSFCLIFIFYLFFFIYLKSKTVKII